MRRRLVLGAAVLYSIAHFAFTGIRQPLANFYGDFLGSFPGWKMAVLFGRLDLYNGSLTQKYWNPPPIWDYGPVQHLITMPLFVFSSLQRAYLAWLFVNYAFVVVVAAPVPFSILQRLTGADAFALYLRAGIPFIGAVLLAIVLVAELGMSYAVSAPEQSCPSKKLSRISAPS
jgi:hypothetical protein